MKKRIIITDSASDISKADEQAYKIRILPFSVAVDGVSYISRVDFGNDGFYKMLENAKELPTTTQITPYQFETLFDELWHDGYREVILVLINSEGSATFNNCCYVAEEFMAEHESEMTIYTVDSRSYTCAYGYPVVEAAKMLLDGVKTEDILAYLKDYMNRSIIYAALYTLKYAGRSGRIPSAAAFVGDALGMKPIMRICDNHITTGDKVRGERNIVPFIAKKMTEVVAPGEPYCIVYGSDDAVRDEMAAAAEETMGYPPAAFYKIGAAIAINAGPKVCGFSSLRKPE